MSEKYYQALPSNLKPFHYDLSVGSIDFSKETFKGKVIISLDVIESTDELHLNYRDLTVRKEGITAYTEVNNARSNVSVISVTEFKKDEYFIIKFDQALQASSKVIVQIEYDAILQTNMSGFYKSGYTEDGEQKCMGSTQFEATDARRAFPCLDEPSLKATFKVDLTLRKDWTALGNTTVAKETIDGDLKTVQFDNTPIMSTYLVAWAVGEFEYIESFTEDLYTDNKPLPVRIYTTKGYLEEAKLALEISPRIVDYFSKVFQIKYPLPKLDLIAVHSFSHNAMENWGLITYRSTALLFSEEKSDPNYKQKVAYVIAHEIAHQWFGNLVTMQWWDELWLNEGFATWVGYYAVDFLYPEWDIFSGFVSESVQAALNLDGLRSSHPIEVPVESALEVDQLFDAISYLKGASTILMISNYLGTETFLQGVALYLNRNKFGNATTDDLWSAISEVSGKPVNQLMESWIKKVGFPIVDVSLDSNALVLRQSRFLNGGDATAEENETKWWVPLSISTDSTTLRDVSVDSFELETLIIDNFSFSEDFFKLNKDTSGAYRVNYSPSILENNILPYITRMSTRDRVGLIADVASIAASGLTSTTTLLKLIKSVVEAKDLESDYITWLELGNRFTQFQIAFTGSDNDLNEQLKKLSLFVYEAKAIQIIDELKAGTTTTDFVQIKLRSNILSHAATLSIEKVDLYAQELFLNWTNGAALPPSLRAFVFSSVASQSTFSEEQFNAIKEEILNPTNMDSREVALEALGYTTNEKLIDVLLNDLLKPEVIPTMDSHYLGITLSQNGAAKAKFLNFFLSHYTEFYDLMTTNMIVFERFIKFTLCNYQSEYNYDQISLVFADKDLNGFERAYHQTIDKIKINSVWYKKGQQEIKEYLS